MFHHKFLGVLQEYVSGSVPSAYAVTIEERVYVTDDRDLAYAVLVPDIVLTLGNKQRIPPPTGGFAIAAPTHLEFIDPVVRDRYLVVRSRYEDRVVTVIELLSPANKVRGSYGIEELWKKRDLLVGAGAHWIEIDLLRGGQRTPSVANRSDYVVTLWRAEQTGLDAWFFDLTEQAPVFALPLTVPDADVPVPLQAIIDRAYDSGNFDRLLRYEEATPQPRAVPEHEAWVRDRIRVWREQSR